MRKVLRPHQLACMKLLDPGSHILQHQGPVSLCPGNIVMGVVIQHCPAKPVDTDPSSTPWCSRACACWTSAIILNFLTLMPAWETFRSLDFLYCIPLLLGQP